MRTIIEKTLDVITEVNVEFKGKNFDNLDEEMFTERISENIDDCMEDECIYANLIDYAILSRSSIFEYDETDKWFQKPICEAMAKGIAQELLRNGKKDLFDKWISSWQNKLSFMLNHDWNGDNMLIYIYITIKQ